MTPLTLEGIVIAALAVAGTSQAQVTELVSISSNGIQQNTNLNLPPPGQFVSADGRFVAFSSEADNLVPGDTNGWWDIFVRDRIRRTTQRVSVSSAGLQGNGNSGGYGISISGDGRFVAFESTSNNLVPGDTNGVREVFVHDRTTGRTERVALDSSGVQGNDTSHYPSISGDGRYVAFASRASNLVPGDTNGGWDIFVRDRLMGATERVSMSTGGQEANGSSCYDPELSADGRFVGFYSNATNLVSGDINGRYDVFIRDRLGGTTDLVSVSTSGTQGNFDSGSADVSDDGRYVLFESHATNLVSGDTNMTDDVFVRDRLSGTTERVNVATDGTQANFTSGNASISGDGRFALFNSFASNLVPGDTNGQSDVFLRDIRHSTTERVSLTGQGLQANNGSGPSSLSPDGRYVVFLSAAALVPEDVNFCVDMFLRDRFAAGFTSLCDPGTNNVIPCPCGNPPSAPTRGCDNSSSTGGASLSASGNAYLAIDSLVFATTDEKPSATSLLLQGSISIPNGLVFGQGVRCAGGTLKRLYVKTASGGSITAPDFSAGDPTVSARSAFLGDRIQPGESRYYLVYYRDPLVLGGCPATSTFNSTQTGQASWWP